MYIYIYIYIYIYLRISWALQFATDTSCTKIRSRMSADPTKSRIVIFALNQELSNILELRTKLQRVTKLNTLLSN